MAIQYPDNGNPFLARLNQLAQGQGGAPAGGMNPAQMQGGPAAAPQAPAGQPGPAGAQAGPQGTTKTLLTAMQALHQFTLQGADPQEVAVVRSMIVILNQLIQRDQMKAQQGGGAQGGQPAPAGRAPQGAGPQVGAQPGQAPLG